MRRQSYMTSNVHIGITDSMTMQSVEFMQFQKICLQIIFTYNKQFVALTAYLDYSVSVTKISTDETRYLTG